MKILCIGRNYKAHADELGNELPDEPLFFMKPETALLEGGGSFLHPPFTEDLHFETELVLWIGRDGSCISEERAEEYIDGVGIGFDLTARDLQAQLKAKGHPWEKAKAFDHAAPVSRERIPISKIPDLSNFTFSCYKNGSIVQEGNTGDLIFSFKTLLAHLSQYITLRKGDLIFTGTPAGVGPLEPGDRLEAFIGRRSFLELSVE